MLSIVDSEEALRAEKKAQGLDDDDIADVINRIRSEPAAYAQRNDARGALSQAILAQAALSESPAILDDVAPSALVLFTPQPAKPAEEIIPLSPSMLALQDGLADRLTNHKARDLLDAALGAMAGPGPHVPGSVHVAKGFARIRASIGTVGYLSEQLRTRIHDHILLLKPPAPRADDEPEQDEEEEEEEAQDHRDPTPSSEDELTVGGLAPLLLRPPDRLQKPPTHWPDTPPLVCDAYRILMAMPEVPSTLRFELVPLLRRVHDNVLEGKAEAARATSGTLDYSFARMLGGGKCQSRKTPLKFVTFVMCRLMGVPTIVITTGTSGMADLFTKFSQLVAGVPLPHPLIPSAGSVAEYHYERGGTGAQLPELTARTARAPESIVLRLSSLKQKHTEWVDEQLLKGACIVANNSSQAILKLKRLIKSARGESLHREMPPLQFALVLDEADDFYRTDGFVEGQEGKRIQMEKALAVLRQYGPLIDFEVTATLLAIFVILTAMGRANGVVSGAIFYTEASSEYVGTNMFRPPIDSDGNPVFLAAGELTKGNCFISTSVQLIWANAASQGRSLLLDATTAGVASTTKGNTTQKAERLLALHPHAIAIVVSGSFIQWRTSKPKANCGKDASWKAFTGKARIFVEILKTIDERYNDRPIFVFGYSQLMRGISYRSATRVPTHLILLFGSAMSLCRLVQAAGRTNGEQLRELNQGGFDHVQVLTLASDFDTIRNYPDFLEAIKNKMENGGLNLEEALASRQEGKFNFSGRTLAQKKLHLNELTQAIGPFDPPAPGTLIGASAIDKSLRVGSRGRGMAVLEALMGLHAYDENEAMTSSDVLEELKAGGYDEFFSDPAEKTMSVQEVLSVLQQHTAVPPHRPALFIKARLTRRPHFFINELALDSIRPRAVEQTSSVNARAERRAQEMRDAVVDDARLLVDLVGANMVQIWQQPRAGDDGSASASLPVPGGGADDDAALDAARRQGKRARVGSD